MQSLVVFLTVAAVAHASLVPLVEPYGYGYAALSPYASSIVAPAVVAPSAVSHQSRVDISSSPAIVAESYSAPLLTAAPVWSQAHLLKKRSLGYLGPIAYSTPIIAPSAVSHQSRVDIKSSPAVVSESIVATPVVAQAVAAPVVAHAIAPSAVSHQSRVDYQSSPAVISESIVSAPALTYASPLYTPYGLHSHILKKRSLGYLEPLAYSAPIVAHAIAPSAVSHQSRVDIKSSPAVVSESIVAAPVVAHAVATPLVAQAIVPSAVSHQSRVDYKSSPAVISESIVAAPVVHSAAIAAPVHAYSLYGW